MTTVNTRDDRWNTIDEKDPEGSIRLIREILRDYEERLSGIDVNGSGLVIPVDYVTETMIANDAVGASQLQANAVTAAKLNADAVSTAKIAAAAVTKVKLAGGFLKSVVLAGGAAGAFTVTGIASGDELVLVLRLNRDATAANIDVSSLTAEFSISAADTIDNTGGTDTTGDSLLVLYLDLT